MTEAKKPLADRVIDYMSGQLPGQVGVHMGTSYLVQDLWNEVKRLRSGMQFMIEEITDLEGREGVTDYQFAEQVIALAQSQRSVLEA